MDLRKFLKPAEGSASANSDYQLSSLGSSSHSAGNQYGLCDPLTVPNLPLDRDRPDDIPALQVPSLTVDASGEIWPNKEVWQYMTLPFTITLALQNLSPYQHNSASAAQLITDTGNHLQLPLNNVSDTVSPPDNNSTYINTPDNNSTCISELAEMLDLSRREVSTGEEGQSEEVVPDVIHQPPKRRYRCSNAISTSKQNNIDMIALSMQNKNKPKTNCSNFSVENILFKASNCSQEMCISNNTEPLKEKCYVHEAFQTETNKASKRLLPKNAMKNGGRKRKGQDLPFSVSEEASAVAATVTGKYSSKGSEQAVPYILLYPDPKIASAFTVTNENLIQNNHLSHIQFPQPTDSPSNEIKALEVPKLIATKGILLDGPKNAKPIKKVRFSEDVAMEKSTKETEVADIPRMVFPIYNNTKSSKRIYTSNKEIPFALAKRMTANEQEIWTIREKVRSSEKLCKRTRPILLQRASPAKGTVTGKVDGTFRNYEPLELATPKTIPFLNPVPSFEPKTSNFQLPTPYQYQLLQCLPQERIKKAYNLHEILLEKLGGTNAMPERKLEIDAFRRDLILELIRKQFDVENVDELRDPIMKYLASQQHSKSCEEIIDNVIKGMK